MNIQFVSFETDPETSQQSVSDITVLSLGEDPKKARRRVMCQLGFMVDKMLAEDRGFGRVSFELEQSTVVG